MAVFQTGHRRKGSGISFDSLSNLERAMVLARHKGSVWYVDSNAASGGNGNSWEGAYQTIVLAVAAAGVDDLILVAPAHAETISAAGTLTIATAGLTIIGLGNGNRRPILTWSAAASTVLVTAADVTISNVTCTCSIDEVVTMFTISGKRCTLDRVDYHETSAMTPIQFLNGTTTADDFTMQNCRHRAQTASASAQLWLDFVGADGVRIVDNEFMLVLSNSATSTTINTSTTACLNMLIARNQICQTGGTTQDNFISLCTGTIGLCADNRIGGDVGTLAASVDLASVYGSETYVATTANKSGIIDPVVA